MDDWVKWIRSAGYPVERVADYDEWFVRFRQALVALDDAARERSSLPLVELWRAPLGSEARPRLDPTSFDERLRSESLEPAPLQSEAFVHRCLGHMVALGLIPRPPHASRRAAVARPEATGQSE